MKAVRNCKANEKLIEDSRADNNVSYYSISVTVQEMLLNRSFVDVWSQQIPRKTREPNHTIVKRE